MLPVAVLDQASRRIAQFAPEWRDEVPLKIHSRGLDGAGYLRWTGEFTSWITGERRQTPESRIRITRAMRTLRKVAPREHETIWKIFAGESVEQVCKWLNDRAIRLGHPERYSLKDTVVLVVSGTDKLAWWGAYQDQGEIL